MMKKLLIILISIVAILLILYFFIFIIVGGMPSITLKYNTVYSINFNEKIFQEIKIGDNYNNIINKIGPPLVIEPVTHYHKEGKHLNEFEIMAYTKSAFSQYDILIGDLSLYDYTLGKDDILNYYFVLDMNGNVIRTKRTFSDYTEEEIFNMNKNQIIDKFGIPNSYIKVKGIKKVMYTQCTEGGHLGKGCMYKLRGFYINSNNQVIKIINKH